MRFSLVVLLIGLLSCNGGVSADTNGDPAQTEPTPLPSSGQDEGPQFTSYFNKSSAWMYMEKQVGFGFRVPGTSAHQTCANWLAAELGRYCDDVEVQEFTELLPVGEVKMFNIIAHHNPEAERRILLAAHWDTRPTADKNPYGQRDQPIEGANDGASGVAVLLELNRVFSAHPPAVGVDIFLTDGEDYGPGIEYMFLGAKYFADNLTAAQVESYNYGILLDMIGDADLTIHPEVNSEARAGLVYAMAYEVSRSLGYLNFKRSGTVSVLDDHVPLNKVGLRVYDFIDFDYPVWHTTEDTLDKCSPLSLEVVGTTVENMVYLFPDIYAPEGT